MNNQLNNDQGGKRPDSKDPQNQGSNKNHQSILAFLAPEQLAPGRCVVFEEKFISGVPLNILCGHMAVLHTDDSGVGVSGLRRCLREKARIDGHASHHQDSQCKTDQTNHHTVNILVHDTFTFSSLRPGRHLSAAVHIPVFFVADPLYRPAAMHFPRLSKEKSLG